MKKLLALLLAAGLLLTAGCAGNPAITTAASTSGTELPTTASQDVPTLPTETLSESTEAPISTEAISTEAASTEALQTSAPAPETAPATSAAPAPTEPVDPRSLLDELSFEQGSYTDEYGNTYSWSYALPCVLADTEGARAINAAIDERFGADVRSAKESMAQGASPGVLSVGYYSAIWEDVLTLVVIERYDYDWADYGVYCYECSTGRRLSTPMLLEKMKVSQDEFLDTCRDRFRRYYEDQYSGIPADQRAAYGYYAGLDQTVSSESVNLELMAYPDSDGDIVVIAPIASLAGPAFFYEPIYLGMGGVG